MRAALALLVLAVLAALASAQVSCAVDPSGSLCPNAPSTTATTTPGTVACTNIVNCLVDPCSIIPTTSTTCNPARCVSSYCGSCNATWYDANGGITCQATTCSTQACGPKPAFATVLCSDGVTTAGVGDCVNDGGVCKWQITYCPVECPLVKCATQCQYGFQSDANGCPTCTCNEPVVCPAVACAVVDEAACIANGGQLYNDGCCTKCLGGDGACNNIACPMLMCPVPAAGQQVSTSIPPNQCCPTCDVVNCLNVDCAMPLCAEGYVPIVPAGQCCPECTKVPTCSSVVCPAFACAPYDPTTQLLQVATIDDGSCCPSCDPLPTCSTTQCDPIKCGPNQESVVPAGQCCPVCRDTNFCDRVLCAAPNCPEFLQQTPTGSCCPSCSPCITTQENGKIVCTADGQPVCSPKYYGINGCTTPMPADQYTEKCFEVTVDVIPDSTTDVKCKYAVLNAVRSSVPQIALNPEYFSCSVGTGGKVILCVHVPKGVSSVVASEAAAGVEQALLAQSASATALCATLLSVVVALLALAF